MTTSKNKILLHKYILMSKSFGLITGADRGKSVVRELITDEVPTYAGYTLFWGLCSTEKVDGPNPTRRIDKRRLGIVQSEYGQAEKGSVPKEGVVKLQDPMLLSQMLKRRLRKWCSKH